MGDQEQQAGPAYEPIPNPAYGEPAGTLELEKYLAEPKAMMKVRDDETGQEMIIGDVPNAIKRNVYALLGKQIINSYYTEKDIRVKKLQNFRTVVKETMWTRTKTLNENDGRYLLDLEQARMYGNDLVTQARDGSHSKQRTTYTSIHMAGRIGGQEATQGQKSTGGFFV